MNGPVVGIDLGGTRIKCGVVQHGEVSARAVRETPASARAALDAAIEAVRELIGDAQPSAIGLSVPGLVDEGGTVVALPGKLDGIEGLRLRGMLSNAFGARAIVCNDAIAYGVGEAAHGAGRSYERSVIVTLGTGVGVVAIDRGHPVTAGVLGGGLLGGFIPIADSGPYPDSIGRTDTIEAHCAARRIVDYANDAGGAFEDVPAVFDAHIAGDAAARAGVERYRAFLVRALIGLAHAHAPGVLVVGGGPVVAGNPLMYGLQGAVNERLFGTYRVDVQPAQLGDDAALIGLGHLALDAS